MLCGLLMLVIQHLLCFEEFRNLTCLNIFAIDKLQSAYNEYIYVSRSIFSGANEPVQMGYMYFAVVHAVIIYFDHFNDPVSLRDSILEMHPNSRKGLCHLDTDARIMWPRPRTSSILV